MIVDVHAHCIPPALLRWLEDRGPANRIQLVATGGGRCVEIDGHHRTAPLRDDLTDLDRRIAEMDRMGIDVQLLSGWIDLTAYQLPSEEGRSYSRAHNEAIAEEASRHPDRLRPMATVPLQDPVAAAEELEYAIDRLGAVGVQIATTVGDRWLDQCSLDPFWETAEGAGALVLLHPVRPLSGLDLDRYFLDNMVGRPAESTIALAGLIFSGVFERFPRLRMCVVHGGGFAPYQVGRMNRGFDAKPGLTGNHIRRPPGEYLERLYFDTVVHDPRVLRFLVDMVGADHVVLGTDYPFEMGEPDPVGLIERAGLDAEARQAVLGGNVASLLG
ncbi:MAG: 2-hydroxy-3-carboxy-6-oxo-7-methylocta-2,4-dienoate decarboxylase [Acidimicrobiia bacterium]|nr:MAG: 2-hydroxy-3-carboxy-6-oxo-7-methylocta-2,4-dienoate decarboxylase [Acidimicrobiia bacterium]